MSPPCARSLAWASTGWLASLATGSGPNRPSRMASASSLVSGSGATPSSRSRVRTRSRYCAMAPATSPERARAEIMSWWAGSWSGSTSSQRRVTSVARSHRRSAARARASRSSAPARSRRWASPSAACHSSNASLSLRAKPSMNGPRSQARASSRATTQAGQASVAGWPWPLARASADRKCDRSTSTDASSSATAERSTTRPRAGEPGTEDRERAPKRVAGVRPIRLRPEQCCQSFTARRTLDHRQIGQQRDRLAGVEGDPAAIDGDLDGAEEPDGQAGGGRLHPRNDTGGRPRTVTIRERSVRHAWSRWDRVRRHPSRPPQGRCHGALLDGR